MLLDLRQLREAGALYWFPDYFDANSNAAAFAFGKGDDGPHTVAWRAGWNVPEISDKTHSAVVEKDPQKRATIYAELQRELENSSPFVFMLQAKDQVVLRDAVKNYVQGINADIDIYVPKDSEFQWVAESLAGEDLIDSIKRADEAMYRAKRKGRDRVELQLASTDTEGVAA